MLWRLQEQGQGQGHSTLLHILALIELMQPEHCDRNVSKFHRMRIHLSGFVISSLLIEDKTAHKEKSSRELQLISWIRDWTCKIKHTAEL